MPLSYVGCVGDVTCELGSRTRDKGPHQGGSMSIAGNALFRRSL